MDYKQKYKEIPKGYKGEISDKFRPISRWLNDHEVSKDRTEQINLEVMRVWSAHNLADTMIVKPDDELVVKHLRGNDRISYYALMSFRIETELSQCITDPTEIKLILDQSETSIRIQLKDNPYSLKLLIAKYLLR